MTEPAGSTPDDSSYAPDLAKSAAPDRRAHLRASTADRSLVDDILSAAMAQGHISPTEYESRATSALQASTFGELDALTDDLPVADIARAGGPSPDRFPTSTTAPAYSVSPAGTTPTVTTKIALMSGTELTGNAAVGDQLQVLVVMGGAEIDLRRVEFTAPTLTIRAFAVMGGIEIVVPEDANVQISGLGIMGGFSHRAAGGGRPGAPTIIVTGLALMGGVEVERKAPSIEKKR